MLNNPLDILFRDIKKELWLEEQKKLREQKAKPKEPIRSTYEDPNNWKLGKVIELKHFSGESLGIFQEYFHLKVPSTRRLMPAAKGLVPASSELVFGDYWLHPQFSAPPAPVFGDDSDEAIISRFCQLMDELDEKDLA